MPPPAGPRSCVAIMWDLIFCVKGKVQVTVFPIQALGKLISLTGIGGTLGLLIAVSGEPAVTVSAQVQRTSLDLLDSLPIAVIVRNPAATVKTLQFRQPAEYSVEIVSDGNVVWSSLPASPPPNVTYPVHTHDFGPGATTLAVYDWNELVSGGSSPVAGKYELRVRLLDEKAPPPVSLRVVFAAPLSPSTLASLRAGQEFTLAGTLG